jgi:putative dimethyl sulfoxide reductase chaperone
VAKVNAVTAQAESWTARQLLYLAALFEYPTAELAERLDVDFEALQNAYVRLFVNNLGGVQAPPYAGCYLTEQDRLEFMSHFSGLCRRSGVALKASQPPDYIPLMMEVLALLLSEGREAAEIKSLVEQSYAVWPERFAEALKQHDETGVYLAIAVDFKELLQSL